MRTRSSLPVLGLLTGSLVFLAAAGADRLSERERAIHALDRLAFGPRPGDVDRVAAMGTDRWIDAQLHPERVAEDPTLEARLPGRDVLSLSTAELIERFDTPVREARKKAAAEAAEKARAGDAPETGGGDDTGAAARVRAMVPPENRPGRLLADLTAARIVRAADSSRQLQEVLVDFWMNHFNVYARKGLDRVAIVAFERDTIRPRIFGRFEDLLLATAKSPAMLVYLDNARSAAEASNRPPVRGRGAFAGAGAKTKGPTGLNENYARELLELHTMGVDGGYTQSDVTELARVLTGWSVGAPRTERTGGVVRASRRSPEALAAPGEFVFRERLHDVGEKTVLGRRFPAGGGMGEGEAAIRMLARNPSTARHLARELCQRLVSDAPPEALVERVAARFLATNGDLREIVRAVVESPEFFDPAAFRAKVKSPFEYAVSAVRALGSETDGRGIARAIEEMGEPLYLCVPPTGYPEAAEDWTSSGALLARMNFALSATRGAIPGTSAPALAPPDGGDLLGALEGKIVPAGLSEASRDAIRSRLSQAPSEPAAKRALTEALLVGSPEFQRQ